MAEELDKNTTKGQPKKFTSEYQPTPEAKSLGIRKKRALKEILEISTSRQFKGSSERYREMAAEYLEIEPEEVDVKMIMYFRQIQKAIQKGDTEAFKAVMDRVYGRPKAEESETQITTEEGTRSVFDLGNGLVFEV
jgi:hypothetical protein